MTGFFIMKPFDKIKVKICCIQSIEEAWIAVDQGASAVGLVADMPSGPGVISIEQISNIAKKIPPAVSTFLLTSKTAPRKIIEEYKIANTSAIQLVDEVKLSDYKILREELPYVKLIQVIHVTDESIVETALNIQNYVDAVLLDSGNPNLKVKELGGTGRVHNWEISEMIRESIAIPVFLAGGLNPKNVKEAIEKVRPYGVDVCSGVRTEGKLDTAKLAAFIRSTHINPTNRN